MSSPVKLNVTDPELWALTLDAVVASKNVVPAVKTICSNCQSILAHAGTTTFGPLFISSWDVEVRGRHSRHRWGERDWGATPNGDI